MGQSTIKTFSLAGDPLTIPGEKLNLVKDFEDTVAIYVVPSNKIFTVNGGSGTTMTDTTWRLYIDGTLMETLHNAWTKRNVYFGTFQKVEENIEIKITAQHKSDTLHDMHASIFGLLL